MIRENIHHVYRQIDKSCNQVGRKNGEVTLIAVSKTKPTDMIMEAYNEGIRDFGENKVQELVAKYEELPKDIRWHMIGHLQTNKVKYLADKVYMIHSVDSYKLAEIISREAQKNKRVIPILIEVNVAKEETKFGVSLTECENLVRKASLLKGISIMGLMTIAPFVDNSQDNQKFFKQLKQLSVDIMNKNIDNVSMDILSMGMSGDYTTAVLEGATYVRVGTGIFGERGIPFQHKDS